MVMVTIPWVRQTTSRIESDEHVLWNRMFVGTGCTLLGANAERQRRDRAGMSST